MSGVACADCGEVVHCLVRVSQDELICMGCVRLMRDAFKGLREAEEAQKSEIAAGGDPLSVPNPGVGPAAGRVQALLDENRARDDRHFTAALQSALAMGAERTLWQRLMRWRRNRGRIEQELRALGLYGLVRPYDELVSALIGYAADADARTAGAALLTANATAEKVKR